MDNYKRSGILRKDNQNPQTYSGFTASKSYKINAASLYTEILLLVSLGIRTLDDEPWEFQLALDEEFSTNAAIPYIAASIEEVREAQSKIK